MWEIPYALTLNHTVEEVLDNCVGAETGEKRLQFLEEKAHLRLALEEGDTSETLFLPNKKPLKQFIKEADFVFMGLHGGIGENGTLQAMLTEAGVRFNASGAKASALCMDKDETGKVLAGMEEDGIFTAPKKSCLVQSFAGFGRKAYADFFAQVQNELQCRTVIVKPQDEGCSSGIVRLRDAQDLEVYMKFASSGAVQIPAGSFKGQKDPVEMPLQLMKRVLFEQFIEVDTVRVKANKLKWKRKKGWIEVTVGVLEEKGKLHALSPSLTVAEGEVLSVEEKFQGGTGVNMTPPPISLVKPEILKKVKQRIEKVAQRLGIQGYCRIDTFMHVDTGDIIVLEANTMPALTPSTVLFHQGLAEAKPLWPLDLLEKLIENKGY